MPLGCLFNMFLSSIPLVTPREQEKMAFKTLSLSPVDLIPCKRTIGKGVHVNCPDKGWEVKMRLLPAPEHVIAEERKRGISR